MTNIRSICELVPTFLAIPSFYGLVFCMDEYFRIFWEFTRYVPYSSLDRIPTRDEQEMLFLIDIIIRVIDQMCIIVGTSRFEGLL